MSDEILTYLHSHPSASRQEVMKALNVSARDVARAEALLDDERFRARLRRRRRLTAAALLLLLTGAGYFALTHHQAAQQVEEERRAQEHAKVVQAQEQALYAALDERSPERVAEARAHLGSEDEALRLAALRYLVTVDPQGQADALLKLTHDPAERVRRAAIQLAAKLPGSQERLVSVALATERPLEERTLAMSGLEGQPSRELARRLLVLLRDPMPAVRAQAGPLLVKLAGPGPVVEGDDPEKLFVAWAQVLEEAP